MMCGEPKINIIITVRYTCVRLRDEKNYENLKLILLSLLTEFSDTHEKKNPREEMLSPKPMKRSISLYYNIMDESTGMSAGESESDSIPQILDF